MLTAWSSLSTASPTIGDEILADIGDDVVDDGDVDGGHVAARHDGDS
jgi:hypothetical protein